MSSSISKCSSSITLVSWASLRSRVAGGRQLFVGLAPGLEGTGVCGITKSWKESVQEVRSGVGAWEWKKGIPSPSEALTHIVLEMLPLSVICPIISSSGSPSRCRGCRGVGGSYSARCMFEAPSLPSGSTAGLVRIILRTPNCCGFPCLSLASLGNLVCVFVCRTVRWSVVLVAPDTISSVWCCSTALRSSYGERTFTIVFMCRSSSSVGSEAFWEGLSPVAVGLP